MSISQIRIRTSFIVLLMFFSNSLAIAQESESAIEQLSQNVFVFTEFNTIELRRLIKETEGEMFELYNNLNEDDYYDVRCYWIAPKNTKIKEWICNPEYLIQAATDEGSNILLQLQGTSSVRDNRIQMINAREAPVLKEKMNVAANESPELMQAILQLNALRKEMANRK